MRAPMVQGKAGPVAHETQWVRGRGLSLVEQERVLAYRAPLVDESLSTLGG
jgi:hypothetical protein